MGCSPSPRLLTAKKVAEGTDLWRIAMTAAPDSRPADARLRAAMDQLHAASQDHDLAGLGEGGLRANAIERIHRSWDVIATSDERWDGIYALMALDNPTPMASSGLPAITAIRATVVRLLSALLAVDATAREPEWLSMHHLKGAIDSLSALYGQLESELAGCEAAA
jgi:hypothetical protein